VSIFASELRYPEKANTETATPSLRASSWRDSASVYSSLC